MGLGEAEAGEARDHLPDALGESPVGADVRCAPAMKRVAVALDRGARERLRLIARRSPSASPGAKPAKASATSSTWSWKMIVPSVSRRTGSSEGCV